jgi:hypothetical protein
MTAIKIQIKMKNDLTVWTIMLVKFRFKKTPKRIPPKIPT